MSQVRRDRRLRRGGSTCGSSGAESPLPVAGSHNGTQRL